MDFGKNTFVAWKRSFYVYVGVSLMYVLEDL